MTGSRCLFVLLLALPVACAAVPLHATVQDAPGRPLDMAACDAWRALSAQQLSRTGAWVSRQLTPADGGDGLLEVARSDSAARDSWLLNDNGESHGILRDAKRRDYALRVAQFFDHLLRDAPRPVWMERGVPALDKGETLGLELLPADD